MAKLKNTDIEDVEVKRTLQDMSKEELIERINQLETLDGIVGVFYANNRKLNELAKSLNNFILDVSKDGKDVFSNWLNLQEKFQKSVETMDWLKNKLGLTDEDIKEEKQRMLPPLEQRNKQ